jgi:hypothetical protein
MADDGFACLNKHVQKVTKQKQPVPAERAPVAPVQGPTIAGKTWNVEASEGGAKASAAT